MNSVTLVQNELVLEKVKRSPFWRMRFKVDGKWSAKSTKLSDLEEAKVFANSEFAKMQVLQEHGIQTNGRRVEEVSKLIYQQMVDKQEAGTGKEIYERYKSIISHYIDPIAGKWEIRSFNRAKMDEYDLAVTNRMGRIPSKATFNQHNIVWRMIFQYARDKKWCSTDDIPVLTVKDKGKKTQRRPDISLQEYAKLRRFLRTYHLSSDKVITQYKRRLLREYIIFLMASGMRPGKEILSLKWKNIKVPDDRPVEIQLQAGKTSGRPITPMNFIKPSLRRLADLTKRTAPDDFLFCTPDGQVLKDESGLVSRMLADAGLRVDENGKNRTAYSLRHSYATFLRIYRDFSFEDLSENMGNSVLMLERHYSHARSTDRALRFATGKRKSTVTDKKIDRIDSIAQTLEKNFGFDPYEAVKQMMQTYGTEQGDDYIAMRALEIEIENWQFDEATAYRPVQENMDYILEHAINRFEWFFNGEGFA